MKPEENKDTELNTENGSEAEAIRPNEEPHFTKRDIFRFVDEDLYEEDFYGASGEVSDYLPKQKTDNTNIGMFRDPVAFSIHEFDEKSKDLWVGGSPDEEPVPDLFSEETIREVVNMYAASVKEKNRKEQEATLIGHLKKTAPGKKISSVMDRRMKRVLVSLLVTVCAGVLLAVCFILAYRHSDSEKYRIMRDHTKPDAFVVDLMTMDYDEVQPEDFLKDIKDSTNVKLSFIHPIDYSAEKEQTVMIKMEDEAGNVTIKKAKLAVIHDKTAPVILAAPLNRGVVGHSVAYKDFVVVRDDYDPEPEITIDNSKVDLSKEGRYPFTFTVTDKGGNTSTLDSVIEITPSHGSVSDDEVMKVVDKVLSEIITEDMDDIHKVWAIYEYVTRIPYTLTEYSYDYKYEGYKILHDNKGDCYGSYAASKLMFDRLGIDNLSLEMSENADGSRHFWNMVSLDGGETWYHYDATHWDDSWNHPRFCMLSTKDLDALAKKLENLNFIYDRDKYPKTPDESYPIPDDLDDIYGEDF